MCSGKILNLSEPQFSYLENGDNACHLGLLQGLGEIIYLGPIPVDEIVLE
jgi:hypothetical protein